MKDLRYDIIGAHFGHIENHPQKQMRELGITYQHSTPQSIGDCWWFWNCDNIPDTLPEYLTEIKLDPIKCIGYGLSEQDANEILNGRKSNENNN